MGALPAVGGLLVLSIMFAFLSPFFLTERNFANLLTQAATLVTLAMALTFVILLGEIDLSAGVTSGAAAVIFVVLANPAGPALHWLVALGIALGFGIATGAFIGFFVARVGIPSFVVTLGLFLGFQGLTLIIVGSGGLYRVQTPEIKAIMNSNMPVWAGWVMLGVILAVSAATSFWDRYRRTRAGVPNRRIAFVWIKLGVIAVLGGARRRRPEQRPRRVDRSAPGRADRGSDRAVRAVAGHLRAGPHAVRPLHLRDRRQRRGRATLRSQGHHHPMDRLRRVLQHRRHRGHLQREQGGCGQRGQRSRDRAERCRRRGGGWREPVRRSRPTPAAQRSAPWSSS